MASNAGSESAARPADDIKNVDTAATGKADPSVTTHAAPAANIAGSPETDTTTIRYSFTARSGDDSINAIIDRMDALVKQHGPEAIIFKIKVRREDDQRV
jgi:hypothetical protein